VDIAGANANTISLADFQLSTGNTNSTANWIPLSSVAFILSNPIVVLISPAGPGIVRVKLSFVDNAIAKNWLQVRVLANSRTGLANDDTFLFGSAPGDVYIDPLAQRVNAVDLNSIRAAISTRSVGVSKIEDVNKDGLVSELDLRVTQSLFAAAAGLRWLALASPRSVAAIPLSRTATIGNAKDLGNSDAFDIALSDLTFES